MNVQTTGSGMKENKTITAWIAPGLVGKLDALARDTSRSEASLVREAIAAYVERETWQVAHIKADLAEAQRGDLGIPHEDMVRWMESWGTDQELPPPEASV